MRKWNRTSLKCVSALAVFVLTVAAASANDIEDFFPSAAGAVTFASSRTSSVSRRASVPRQWPAIRHPRRSFGRLPRRRVSEGFAAVHRTPAFSDAHEDVYENYDLRLRDHRRRIPVTIRPSSRLSTVRGQEFAFGVDDHSEYGVSLDWSYETPPLPLPPASQLRRPLIPAATQLHHEIGDIVDCPVVLEPCVRIEDPENIAPQGRPVVMAVKDPHHSGHHSDCAERPVYVVVYLPPCPPECVTISPCGTRITLSFDEYEVKIRSRRGWVVISYCD